MSDPQPSAPDTPTVIRDPYEGVWRSLLAAGLVVILVIAALAYAPAIIDSVSNAAKASSSETQSGTTKIRAGDRRLTVALATGVTKDTVVSATVLKGGKQIPARVIGPTSKSPQFAVVLGNPAAKTTTVTWKAAGLDTGGGAATNGWSVEWVVVLSLMALSLVAALVAFWVAVRRRRAGTEGQVDVGPELASFLKVAALLMIAALALIAVMLATDDKSLTGLFALLGTIAGYLAGNRSQTTGGQPRADGRRGGRQRGPKGGAGAEGQVPEDASRLTAPVPETRSLL